MTWYPNDPQDETGPAAYIQHRAAELRETVPDDVWARKFIAALQMACTPPYMQGREHVLRDLRAVIEDGECPLADMLRDLLTEEFELMAMEEGQ